MGVGLKLPRHSVSFGLLFQPSLSPVFLWVSVEGVSPYRPKICQFLLVEKDRVKSLPTFSVSLFYPPIVLQSKRCLIFGSNFLFRIQTFVLPFDDLVGNSVCLYRGSEIRYFDGVVRDTLTHGWSSVGRSVGCLGSFSWVSSDSCEVGQTRDFKLVYSVR